MSRLTLVELRRLAARKVVWITLLGAVAIALVTLFGVFSQARQIDQARAGADATYQQMVADHEQMTAECLQQEAQERRRTGDPSVDYACDEMGPAPTIEDMYGTMPGVADQAQTLFQGLVFAFAFLALAMGSTAVAAEFAHRTMGTWLTFEPRRTPVFFSKLLAPALAAIPMVVLGLALVLVGVPAIYRWFGLDVGLGGDDWSSLLWASLRVVVVAVAAAALGASAAFILRHSGVVIGVVVGYLVVLEGMLGSAVSSIQPFLLGRNVAAFVNDGVTWETYTNCTAFECTPVRHSISLTHGAVELTLLLVILTTITWAHFRTADVD